MMDHNGSSQSRRLALIRVITISVFFVFPYLVSASILEEKETAKSNICVETVEGQATSEPRTVRSEFLTYYIFLNTWFPQHTDTISIGVTAFILAKDIHYRAFEDGFSDDEWNRIFNTMTNAHNRYGVRRVVTLEELKAEVARFWTRIPLKLSRVIKVMTEGRGFPKFKRPNDVVEYFYSEDRFESERVLLHSYGETIMTAWKDPEIREFSRQFKSLRDPKVELSNAKRRLYSTAPSQLQDRLLIILIERHPELAQIIEEVDGTHFSPPQPIGKVLIDALSLN